MTKERSFKRRVRERMSKTGERYTSARSQVSQKRDRVQAARTTLAADRPASDAKVEAVTGRTWEAWFSILDRWGARERKYREMVGFLMDDHGVEAWWAQAITYSYERSRGMRLKHQQMSLRTSQPGHTARFDWENGSTRVSVSFEETGPSKTAVAVAHERLPDAEEAETTKAAWRRRLSDLKTFVES
jgi:Domain of unknown function (DUF4287)